MARHVDRVIQAAAAGLMVSPRWRGHRRPAAGVLRGGAGAPVDCERGVGSDGGYQGVRGLPVSAAGVLAGWAGHLALASLVEPDDRFLRHTEEFYDVAPVACEGVGVKRLAAAHQPLRDMAKGDGLPGGRPGGD